MIIKHFELKKNLDKKINFFLIYGQNRGLVEEIIDNVLKPIFPTNILNYEETEILNNLDNFKIEIFNKSFFDNNKLIIINRTTDKILQIIKEIIDQKISNIKIILKSGVLDKKSKLRSFFEKNKKGIVIPLYEDNNQTLLFIVEKFFKKENIKLSKENMNLIVERAKGDRINLKNELEKIKNYCLNKSSLTFEEVLRLTNLAENYDMSKLADYCLSHNQKKTLNILNENNYSADDSILIIKTFLYKLKRLKKLKIEIELGQNIDVVMSSFKPPIFWKDKEIIKQQLQTQSLKEIKNSIKSVNDLEITVKKNTNISNQLVNNFILEKLNSVSNMT